MVHCRPLEINILIISYLNKFLMWSKVTNFLVYIFGVCLQFCPSVSTVHTRYIQPILSSSVITSGMTKQKYEINTGMKILNDICAVLKLQGHPVIGPIYLGTCTIFKLSVEMIYLRGDGLLVSMSYDGGCCVCINIFRVQSMIFINILYICNC